MNQSLRLRAMETFVKIPGLRNELTIMHVTDSHLTEADDRDDAVIRQLATERTANFVPRGDYEGATTVDMLSAHIRLCNEIRVDGSVFTGDIIDFPSRLNVDLIKGEFGKLAAPYLYTLGNHDWSYPHMDFSDELRISHYDRFREWSARVPGCEALEIGGVKLIAVDNSNYQLTWEQFQFVRQHAEAGKPCLLFMHIPMYLPSLEQDVVRRWGSPIMMGAINWTTEGRRYWNVRETDDSTAEFCRWLSSQEQDNRVFGVFCGHVHIAHMDAYRPERFQYITEPGFSGGCRILKLTPTT